MSSEQQAGRVSSDDPPPTGSPKILKVKPSVGVMTVGPAVFPRKGDGDGSRRRGGNSNFSQKRTRVWMHVVSKRLSMITTFRGIAIGETTVHDAARRLRERHSRRLDTDCDYLIITDGRLNGDVHVFTPPYGVDDMDTVVGLFSAEDPEPGVRVVADLAELEEIAKQAASVLRVHNRNQVRAMSRTGRLEELLVGVGSVTDGLELARQIVPCRLVVERSTPFGQRARLTARFAPHTELDYRVVSGHVADVDILGGDDCLDDRLHLQEGAGRGVSVDVDGGSDVGVAEILGEQGDVVTARHDHAGEEVAELVGSESVDASLESDFADSTGDGVGTHHFGRVVAEHVAVSDGLVAGEGSMVGESLAEAFGEFVGEDDHADRVLCLRCGDGETASVGDE